MTTVTDICNRALAVAIAQYTLTAPPSSLDTSTVSKACALLYDPAWKMMLREQDMEFARFTDDLVAGGTATYPWANAYLYPSDCLKIRSVVPVSWDPFDPQAIRWSEQSQVIATVPTRVILTNVPAAKLVYTTSNVTPDEWDATFQEAVVRFLGSQLALALAGRPDLSRGLLAQSGSVLQSGEAKDS